MIKNFGEVYVGKSRISGDGLFAGRNFKKGEIVCIWHPQILSTEEFKHLPERKKHYAWKYGDGYKLQQEPACYVNFSCNPNTKVVGEADVAIRDIAKGEEITSSDSGGEIPYTCTCGSPQCKSNQQNATINQ